MRHRRRVDKGQPAIVATLRRAGYSVAVVSDVGRAFADLVVGYRDDRLRPANVLMEVKQPGGELNALQEAFHAGWVGDLITVSSPAGALRAMRARQVGPVSGAGAGGASSRRRRRPPP